MLTVYLDVKCPASYLAFGPLRDLGDRLGIPIEWLPFRSRQKALAQPRDDETKGEMHRRVRAAQRRDVHLRYAGVQGLPMVFRDPPAETDVAMAGLICAGDAPEAYLAEAFAAYWGEGEDLNAPGRVLALLQDAGVSASADDLARAGEALADHQAAADERGVFLTPTLLVGEHMFLGREHLPLIENVLRGEISLPTRPEKAR